VRVCITTGLVVVGDLIGVGASQEQAVVGETPNLAARFHALAEPVASSTRRLTGGLFENRDLAAVTLKGFAEHVAAWHVLGPGAAESRFEALRATTIASRWARGRDRATNRSLGAGHFLRAPACRERPPAVVAAQDTGTTSGRTVLWTAARDRYHRHRGAQGLSHLSVVRAECWLTGSPARKVSSR